MLFLSQELCWLEYNGRREGTLVYSDKKAETNGLFALGRYPFANLTITMIIMRVAWFPVELKEFFCPFCFNCMTVMQFAVNKTDTKLGAVTKVKFFSLLKHSI